MLLHFLPSFSADDGGGSGGSDDEQGKIKPSDILNRYGQTAESALRMAEKLAESENANYQLREKNRTLRHERDALKANQPADGTVILSADEAAALDAYKALGTPAALKQALTGAETATAELATLRRKAELHDVQAATGYDPDVLAEIGKDWAYTFKDEQIEGKPVKVVYVKDGDQETRLDAHPKVQKFMPALKPAQPAADPPAPRNTSFVQQHGGQGSAGDLASQYLAQQDERRKAQPNPLMKQGA